MPIKVRSVVVCWSSKFDGVTRATGSHYNTPCAGVES